MNKFFKNPALYAVLVYCLLFLTSIFTIGSGSIKDIIDYIVLFFSLVFFFKWIPNTLEAFNGGGIERKFRLSLGLALTAAGLAGQRIWIILVNQTSLVSWADKDAVSAFIGSWFIGALLLCLSIDAPEDGIRPQLRWYYTTILIGFGAVFGFLFSRILFP